VERFRNGLCRRASVREPLVTYTLKLILFEMKTGYTELHEFELAPPSTEGGCYTAHLPHRLYHRIEAHFGRGPFTTTFMKSHGPLMLYGFIKTDKELQIPVAFEEKD